MFSDETRTDGVATSNDGGDSADSVVMGWRGGLEMHPSVAIGRMGALEMRERGTSDGGDSGESPTWGESCDSRVAESDLGLNTGRMPQTSPFLLDYDDGVSGGNGRICSESEESDGGGAMGVLVPKSRARATQAMPQRAVSRARRRGLAGENSFSPTTGSKTRGREKRRSA